MHKRARSGYNLPMVTIEILKKSQRTRPRHYLPVMGWIFFVLMAVLAAGYACVIFNVTAITSLIPNANIAMPAIGADYPLVDWIKFLFGPLAILILGIPAFVVEIKMCSYRRGYWGFGWLVVLLFIAILILDLYCILYRLFGPIRETLDRFVPANVADIIFMAFHYGNFGYAAVLAFCMFFAIIYNVNYPAKYEDIYALRKARIKAYTDLDDRIAYKKRFYEDYKLGNWNSMMFDLHFASLDPNSKAPMREDAFEFMVYLAGVYDSNVQAAVLRQYAREGRYYEARNLFAGTMAKSKAVDAGAKVILSHYGAEEPAAPSKPARKRMVEEKPVPRLAPTDTRRPKDIHDKHWTPDDIS